MCDLLKIGYSETQADLMYKISRTRGFVDAGLDDPEWAGDPLRAALMAVLWHILVVPGTRATILAPSKDDSLACGELGNNAMAFLAEVCVTRDVCLRSITAIRQWNRLEFAGEAGWEVRLIPNVPAMAAEAALLSRIGLILDAGCSQPAFVEAQKALEQVVKEPRGLLIRLW
jgi:hypothetical protein